MSIDSETLRRLLAETTPGPWRVDESLHDYREADARLIALAPTLAQELLEARERIAKLERVVREYLHWHLGLLEEVMDEDREAQRRSFAYGNVAMHDERAKREDIDKAAADDLLGRIRALLEGR